jgi:hypothetical protein
MATKKAPAKKTPAKKAVVKTPAKKTPSKKTITPAVKSKVDNKVKPKAKTKVETKAKPVKAKKPKVQYPIVIRGSHSTRTEYEDGRVDFVTHWDELVRDVQEALAQIDSTKPKKATKAKRALTK